MPFPVLVGAAAPSIGGFLAKFFGKKVATTGSRLIGGKLGVGVLGGTVLSGIGNPFNNSSQGLQIGDQGAGSSKMVQQLKENLVEFGLRPRRDSIRSAYGRALTDSEFFQEFGYFPQKGFKRNFGGGGRRRSYRRKRR